MTIELNNISVQLWQPDDKNIEVMIYSNTGDRLIDKGFVLSKKEFCEKIGVIK
jgi:hypothetical protein